MSKTTIKVVGWIVSVAVAIIGTFGATTAINNKNVNNNSNEQKQNQNQEQNIVININGEEVEINEENAQSVYGDLEAKKNEFSEQVDTLKTENESLNTELTKFKEYGTEALVSKNKSYNEKKVSLFAFNVVESNGWTPNEGSLNDSLGNSYSVSLDYIILSESSWATYYTNGKFSKLDLRLATHEAMEQGGHCVVKVFADDSLVFTSDEFSRTSEAKKYTVPLKNAKFIKIVCEGSWRTRLLLLDATLIK